MEPFDEREQEEFIRELHVDNLRRKKLFELLEEDEEGGVTCEKS